MFHDKDHKTHRHSHSHILRGMGRHRGPGMFGRGAAKGFMGGDGMPGGRKLSAGDLQLIILALLEERPAHGYELIRILEERSKGFYAPSPGMIYPVLTYLDEIGHAAVEPEGNRKLYKLTEEGRKHLDDNRQGAEAMLDALARIGERMDGVREAFAGLDALDPKAADQLHKARHAIKHAFYSMRDCTPVEARQITAILERATAEILSVKK